MAKKNGRKNGRPDRLETIVARDSADNEVGRFHTYADGSVRVKVHAPNGAVMEECFLGPSKTHNNVIIKLRPR